MRSSGAGPDPARDSAGSATRNHRRSRGSGAIGLAQHSVQPNRSGLANNQGAVAATRAPFRRTSWRRPRRSSGSFSAVFQIGESIGVPRDLEGNNHRRLLGGRRIELLCDGNASDVSDATQRGCRKGVVASFKRWIVERTIVCLSIPSTFGALSWLGIHPVAVP